MFDLPTDRLPNTREELIEVLRKAVSRMFRLGSGIEPVVAEGPGYPRLIRLAIDLTEASVRADFRPRKPVGECSDAGTLSIERFEVHGHPIYFNGAAAQMDLAAEGVLFRFGRDSSGHLILMLANASRGELSADIPCRDIESLILSMARTPAAEHGVTIERVDLCFSQSGSRSLRVHARVTAKKRVVLRTVTAVIEIDGSLDLSDDLVATVHSLRCQGDGIVGSLGCRFIRPHLDRYNGRGISLAAIPLGNARLRDVQIRAGSSLHIEAKIGA